MNTTATATIRVCVKRDGRKVPFNRRKIADAIFNAAQAVGGDDRALADRLAVVVTMFLEKKLCWTDPRYRRHSGRCRKGTHRGPAMP